MASTHADIVKRAEVVVDRVSEQTNTGKSQKETHGSQEETTVRAIRDVLMDEGAEGSAMKQEQDQRDAEGNRDCENPRSSPVHGMIRRWTGRKRKSKSSVAHPNAFPQHLGLTRMD